MNDEDGNMDTKPDLVKPLTEEGMGGPQTSQAAPVPAEVPPEGVEAPKPLPKLPLFITDSRFKIIERQFVMEMQKRFSKLYDKTADKLQRDFPFEVLGWLAGVVMHQVRSVELGFGDKGWKKPEEAFLQMLNMLISNYREAVAEAGRPPTMPEVITTPNMPGLPAALKPLETPETTPVDLPPLPKITELDDDADDDTPA